MLSIIGIWNFVKGKRALFDTNFKRVFIWTEKPRSCTIVLADDERLLKRDIASTAEKGMCLSHVEKSTAQNDARRKYVDAEMRRLFREWMTATRFRCETVYKDAERTLHQYLHEYANGDDRKLTEARAWVEDALRKEFSK